MPSTIPYDPSLVMGQIVDKSALQNVQEIAGYQAHADAAQDKYNGLLASKRSLDMTLLELNGLKLAEEDLKPLREEIQLFNKDVASAAVDYAKAKIVAEQNIAKVRAKIPEVHVQWESPVDYVRTQLKPMALAADSINMDVQYFSTESNDQRSSTSADDIASFATAKMGIFGTKVQTSVAAQVHSQVNSQREKHDIEGTLVISATCTHKNATVLAPFIMNVDKAIKVWNQMWPQKENRINPTSPEAMTKLAEEIDSEEGVGGKGKPSMTLISGVTYGSSFVGMVHILRTTSTSTSEKLMKIASQAQVQLEVGAWYNKKTGGFGVDKKFGNDVKNLLSTQNVQSHVTMTCMGLIPTIKSNEIKLGVKQFANFDGKKSMEQIAELDNATAAEQESVQQSAASARKGGEMVAITGGTVKAALEALGELSRENDKILDINSMMSALDDYLAKAADLTGGVPINYYLKPVTKDMLAEMWVSKYYPGQYMQIKGDDSEDYKKSGDNNNSSSGNNNTSSGGDEGGDN
ncbi:hypothetical protein ACSS6W_011024 [Trichoderma asperelloides]|uniref:Uncharacterized protein n=1 Tax=Trichoderma asperellum TaxID=101201 RepID=A0A6V8R3A1_TRIAP|nr:hypothetical protein LI328DRAFT_164304 [Trichoderma asperelloides]GFP59040.1 hypothetical protein TASIC1_0012004300 [Trichoderma asperellum]